MTIVVQKFGGTSVATTAMRCRVVEKVRLCIEKGHSVVVVVSAMGRHPDPYATDTLLGMLAESGMPDARDKDMVAACGELMACAVLASALRQAGLSPYTLSGWQAGIQTDDTFGDAKILGVDSRVVKELLSRGLVPVIAGFQGSSADGSITTLGRGGSDTTATAMGVALNADRVEIHTDVTGIMTADPKLVQDAKVLNILDYAEVFQMANQGSKVIHPRAVALAMQRNIPLVVKSTFSDAQGTTISNTTPYEQRPPRPVTAVAHMGGVTRVSIALPPDDYSTEMAIFECLATAGISVDLINVSPEMKRFIISSESTAAARIALAPLSLEAEFLSGCAKVSVIGTGMRGMPGVMARVVAALRAAEVRILQSSDSHLTISVLVAESDMGRAVNALHRHFELYAN